MKNFLGNTCDNLGEEFSGTKHSCWCIRLSKEHKHSSSASAEEIFCTDSQRICGKDKKSLFLLLFINSTDNSENQLYLKAITLKYYNSVPLKCPLFVFKLASQLNLFQVEVTLGILPEDPYVW